MTEAELLNEFLETNSYVGERPWREMSDLDEDEDDEEEDEDEDDEDEEDDEDDEDDEETEKLHLLGDVEGHDFHGNQWTDADSTPRASEVDRLQDAFVIEAGLDPRDVPQQQLSDGISLLNIHSDVRGYTKGKTVAQLSRVLNDKPEFIRAIGGDYFTGESYVQHKLDTWAATSGDSDTDAVLAQLAVKDTFSLHDAGTNHLGGVPYLVDEQKLSLKTADEMYARAEYEHTQSWLKEHNIEHVTVFRGMYGVNVPIGTKQEVTMQPASSWTTDIDTALSFALEGADHRRVLSARVPANRVLSTAVTGRGALTESEVILLGGKTKVNSYDLIANKSNQIRFRDELIMITRRVKADMR